MTGARFRVSLVLMGVAGLSPLVAAPQQGANSGQAIASTQRTLLDKYCATCHSERLKTGGVVLEKIDTTKAGDHAELWEKVAEKIRGGMMPPPGMPRPDKAALDGLATWAENELDRAYLAHSNPGRVGLHRLNRAEYGNAVRDLLDLEVDPAELLPADDSSAGFDNIADALTVSPVLLERYLSAAWKISSSRLAIPTLLPRRKPSAFAPTLRRTSMLKGCPSARAAASWSIQFSAGRRVSIQGEILAEHGEHRARARISPPASRSRWMARE